MVGSAGSSSSARRKQSSAAAGSPLSAKIRPRLIQASVHSGRSRSERRFLEGRLAEVVARGA